jgi:hypothetical protein
MKKIVRTIFASFIGILIGLCTVELMQALQAKIYPASHLIPTYAERLKDIETAPTGAGVISLIGFILASFMGGYTAARIACTDHKWVAAFSTGFLFLLGCLVLFISLPFQLWLSISASTSTIVFAWLGYKIATANQQQVVR